MSFCCTRQGVDLVRAEYIPDDIDDIRQTVLRLKDRVGPNGVIFSSGGIGPTHDDVTYAGIASAFGMSLLPSNQVVYGPGVVWMVLDAGILVDMHVLQTVQTLRLKVASLADMPIVFANDNAKCLLAARIC